MRTTCKNADCGKPFIAERGGARYCSVRCRVAAHRKRQVPELEVMWLDGKRRNVTDALAEHLIKIAQRDDDGAPKTGRRVSFLARRHRDNDVGIRDTVARQRTRRVA